MAFTMYGVYRITFSGGVVEGMHFLVVSFFLGYRTQLITGQFTIHPAEILIVAMLFKTFFMELGQYKFVPLWLKYLVPFLLISVLTGFYNGNRSDALLAEFKNFFYILPIFYLTGVYLLVKGRLAGILRTFIWTMAVISFLGILEHYVGSAKRLMSAFFSSVNAEGASNKIAVQELFNRAEFTFWGSPTVANIIAMAVPFVLLFPSLSTRYPFNTKSARVILFLILMIAVYISGNRAGWISIFFFMLVYYLIYVRHRSTSYTLVKAYLIGTLAFGSLMVFSNVSEFGARLGTIVSVISGDAKVEEQDGSIQSRTQRFQVAYKIAKNNPFGAGWAGSGWAHTDFVQFYANTGWIPGTMFFGAFVYLLMRALLFLSRLGRVLADVDARVFYALLMAYLAVGLQLAINQNYILIQSGIPLFFLWAAMHHYLHILRFRYDDR